MSNFTADAWDAATSTENPSCRVLSKRSLARIAERHNVSIVEVDYGHFGADRIPDVHTVTPSGDGRYLCVRLVAAPARPEPATT
jgi:hypothetical protein